MSFEPGGVRRRSYREFVARVRALARSLVAEGIRPGDRVATFGVNHLRHLELYFAVPLAGAVLHPLNVRLPASDLGFILREAGDRWLFIDRNLRESVRGPLAECSSIERLVEMSSQSGEPPLESGGSLPGAVDFGALDMRAPDAPLPPLREDQPAVLSFTSGTTGPPKGVFYSHRTLVLHAMGTAMADSFALSERDTVLVVVPLFHANAWGLPYAAAMVGAKQVLPGASVQPEHLARIIGDEGVTFAAAVPSVWLPLFEYLVETGTRIDTVERLVAGGAPPSRTLVEAFEREFSIPLIHSWGMTEMAPVGTLARVRSDGPGDPESAMRSRMKQGAPVPGVELRVVDEEGVPLPWDGESAGELQARGLWVASSYAVSPDDPSETTREDRTENGRPEECWTEDGWFRTGDIATIDPDGFMEIQDRAKDLIKSGGEWISSVRLERMIGALPGVRECAVVAAPEPRWTERPVLYLSLTENAKVTRENLEAHLCGPLPRWWVPDRIEVVDTLPKTGTGKIDKKHLRAELQGIEPPNPPE